jgi:serine/threonine protein kinase
LKPNIYSNDSNFSIYHDYGQPEYVAPEIVTKSPITLNTDMWSVGVLTYVILTGKSPFCGKHPKETLENIEKNNYIFTSDFNSISREAKDFIQRLLLIDPKERLNIEQALNHPWIHFSSQQTSSALLNKQNLIQHHSMRVWSKSAKQMQPWSKLIKISKILDDIDLSDTGISSLSGEDLSDGSNDKDKEETKNENSELIKQSRGRSESYEEMKIKEKTMRCSSDDEETLNAGNYLLPVKDPFFTVRLREYRRTRYEKVKQIEIALINKQQEKKSNTLTNSSTTTLPYSSNSSNQKTIKERYHVDIYGRCIHRGSLSRSNEIGGSLFRNSQSTQRDSESPSTKSLSHQNNTLFNRKSPSAEKLAKPFQHFVDQKYDKRNKIGEGLAPIIREKLKDTYLIVGSIVTLRCKIEGNPTPRCFWYHNDRLIIGDDDRFKFAQAEDGVTTLSVYKARVSDIGVYRCAARNQFGTALTKARLTVGDTPDRPTVKIHFYYLKLLLACYRDLKFLKTSFYKK